MIRFLKSFAGNATGATAIEYALVASLISIAIVAGATAIGGTLSNTFTTVGGSL